MSKLENRQSDDRRREEIEKFLMYMALYDKGFGCPSPMFFDGAVPSYVDTMDLLASRFQRSLKMLDAAADQMARIEGAVISPADASNFRGSTFSVLACRPMSFHEKGRLAEIHGGRFPKD